MQRITSAPHNAKVEGSTPAPTRPIRSDPDPIPDRVVRLAVHVKGIYRFLGVLGLRSRVEGRFQGLEGLGF